MNNSLCSCIKSTPPLKYAHLYRKTAIMKKYTFCMTGPILTYASLFCRYDRMKQPLFTNFLLKSYFNQYKTTPKMEGTEKKLYEILS